MLSVPTSVALRFISWMTSGFLTRVIKLVILRAATLRSFVIALSVTWRRLEG